MIAVMCDKEQIQAEVRYLADCQNEYPQAVQLYFEHYGLDWPGAEHRFGWFESGGLRLAGHVWMPSKVKSKKVKGKSEEAIGKRINRFLTCVRNDGLGEEDVRNDDYLSSETVMVIVLHGYLNHTGQLKHLIKELLDNNFSVGSFDLPGHGLSEGRQASVETFEEYTQALLDFVRTARTIHRGKLHLIGFSTSAAVAIDLIKTCPEEIFDKIILAGPLIRWRGYNVSKAMCALYSPFTDKIPRMHQKNSSDDSFLSFNRNDDYLHCRHVSLDWIQALYDWNDKIERASLSNREVLILQGNRDTTLDWRYNIRLLQKKFPAARIELIKGARHELFNENSALREECLAAIANYLLDTK